MFKLCQSSGAHALYPLLLTSVRARITRVPCIFASNARAPGAHCSAAFARLRLRHGAIAIPASSEPLATSTAPKYTGRADLDSVEARCVTSGPL